MHQVEEVNQPTVNQLLLALPHDGLVSLEISLDIHEWDDVLGESITKFHSQANEQR